MKNHGLSRLENIVSSESSANEMMYSVTSPIQTGGSRVIIDMTPIFNMIKMGHFEQFFGLIDSSIDFSAKDENGNTIMHLIMLNIDKLKNLPNFANLFRKLLKKMTKTELNIQNMDGNTILHIAVIGGEHGIASELINAGIDRNIKNNNKLRVISSTVKSEQQPNDSKYDELKRLLEKESESSAVGSDVKKQISELIARGAPPITLSASTPDASISKQFDVNDVANSVKNFFTNSDTSTIGYREPITGGKKTSRKSYNISSTSPMFGGAISATSSAQVNENNQVSATSDMLSTETFVGGVLRKKTGGSRKIMNFNDSSSNDFDDGLDSQEGGMLSDVQRLLNSRRDEIHENTKKLIKENMEKVLGHEPTEQEVLDVLSYLYKKMRIENPELLGEGKGLDRAVVVESMAGNMQILENINQKELDEISESKRKHFSEKEKIPKEKRERKHKRNDTTTTTTTSTTDDSSEEKPKKKRVSKKK
jgi:hypothetical protein